MHSLTIITRRGGGAQLLLLVCCVCKLDRPQGCVLTPAAAITYKHHSCHKYQPLTTHAAMVLCVWLFPATRCRAVFLHVITYNTAAMSLYSRQGFSCVAKLRGFYFIATGRTPDPQQQVGV